MVIRRLDDRPMSCTSGVSRNQALQTTACQGQHDGALFNDSPATTAPQSLASSHLQGSQVLPSGFTTARMLPLLAYISIFYDGYPNNTLHLSAPQLPLNYQCSPNKFVNLATLLFSWLFSFFSFLAPRLRLFHEEPANQEFEAAKKPSSESQIQEMDGPRGILSLSNELLREILDHLAQDPEKCVSVDRLSSVPTHLSQYHSFTTRRMASRKTIERMLTASGRSANGLQI
ncbi:F-box domain-containing protein [Histoplasma capsulatum]|uniref:F-box domain-containing protein n=1 Tax=Ajellomyces capsulatus TaxID=5037 RepID=A0A8A1MD45_AJECA|nr:F-box domain-containing protein [Histoplasma capsulatum]